MLTILFNPINLSPVLLLWLWATPATVHKEQLEVRPAPPAGARAIGCAVEAIEEALPLVGADQHRLVQDVAIDSAKQLVLGRTDIQDRSSVESVEREDVAMGT
jgi:hypothetical protein